MRLIEKDLIRGGDKVISLEVFLTGLMVVSTLTGLATEAVKKVLKEYNVTIPANTLAGIVAAVLSAIIGVAYIVFMGTGFTAQIIVCIVALILMGWLGAMIGYDKIISLFKTTKKD